MPIEKTEEQLIQEIEEEQGEQIDEMLEEVGPPVKEEEELEAEEDEKEEKEEEGIEKEDESKEEGEDDEEDKEDDKEGDKEEEDIKSPKKDREKEEEIPEISPIVEQLEEVAKKLMSEDKIDLNPPPKPEDKEKIVQDSLPFVSEEVYEKVLSGPKELNNLMNQVYNTAITNITKSLPTLLDHMVTQKTQMQNLVSDFYKTNEDLVPLKNYVGFVSNQLASEHPDWGYEKLFDEVAIEVRKKAGLVKKVEEIEKGSKEKRPGFLKPPKGKRSIHSAKLSELEEEIDELM